MTYKPASRFHDDSDVDGEDLAIWRGQFGQPTVVAAAPEPASWTAALIAGMIVGPPLLRYRPPRGALALTQHS